SSAREGRPIRDHGIGKRLLFRALRQGPVRRQYCVFANMAEGVRHLTAMEGAEPTRICRRIGMVKEIEVRGLAPVGFVADYPDGAPAKDRIAARRKHAGPDVDAGIETQEFR